MNTLPTWLQDAFAQAVGHRAHALLVHGPGDVGQYAFARALAASWLCETPMPQACGQCAACKLLQSGTHADFRLLVPDALRTELGLDAGDEDAAGDDKASKAKPSKDIRIDAVRAAIDWAHSTSARGRGKVLVIHPAEALNLVSANALLKTLEEPPGVLRLVLTTQDPEWLLATVRSRCQRLALPMPQNAEALAWLETQGVDDGAVLLAAAGGRPGDALSMWTQGITATQWQALPQAAHNGGLGAHTGAWPLPRLIDALQKLSLDWLAWKQGAAPRYFSREALHSLPQPEVAALLAWSRDLLQTARHAEHPWHAELKIQAVMARAQSLWQTPRTPARAAATLRRT
jgi:DNA polymerase III subunit delta'